MNLVLSDSKTNWELIHSFFPNEHWLVVQIISTEKELVYVLDLKKKQPGVSLGVLLSKPDARLLHKAKQAGLWTGVLGNNLAASLFAVQQKADALVQPFGFQKPFFDLSVLRVASQNEVSVGVLFSDFLRANQLERVAWLRNAFFLGRCAKKTKTRFLVWSGARVFEECRTESDLDQIRNFFVQPSYP